MLKDRSFKFSANEIAVLSLVFCVSLVVAFWLGYRTGHTVGFDYAQNVNLNNIARYPINDFAAPELDSESVEQIYARLSDDVVSESATDNKQDVPALAPIVETKAEVPKIELPAEVELKNKPAIKENSNVAPQPAADSESKGMIANLDALPQERIADNAAIPMVIENKKSDVAQKEQTQMAKVATAETTALKNMPVQETKTENQIQNPEIENSETLIQSAKKTEVKKEEIVKTDIAKKAEVPKKEELPQVKKKISTGWYAQVFAPQDKAVADKLASTLRQSGFAVTVEPASGHYRVLVGPESNKQQGQVLLQQLSREKYLPGTPFLKQVK